MWYFKDSKNFNNIPNWTTDYFETEKGKWAKLDNDKLNHAIEESRIFLQTLWDGYGRLTQKALFLLGYIVALLGYISTKMLFNLEVMNSMLWYEKLSLLVYLALLIYIFFSLIRYQLPIYNASAGTQPKDIFKKDVMNCDYEEIIVKQLELCQKSIYYSQRLSLHLSNKIRCYFWVMLIYPIVVIFVFQLLYFLYLK